MIFSTDATGSLAHLSLEWTKLTGQEQALIGDGGWLACVHADDQEIVRDILADAAATVSEFSMRFRLCFADGSVRWIGAGGVPSFGPPEYTFLGYLGSMTELTANATDVMQAYGSVGRFLPPPTHASTLATDQLDAIADHLIIAYSLIEDDGGKPALPALREALFEIGRALARKTKAATPPN